jgi:hypothetical protein
MCSDKKNKLIEEIKSAQKRFQNDSIESKIAILKSSLMLKEEYYGRYIYELIQNASDQQSSSIKIVITPNEFIIANKGEEFDASSLYNLILNMSEKASKNSDKIIGHKGAGFNSVFSITNNPTIYTKDMKIFFIANSK